MIIGPDFVWLHFPKCAGSAMELALQKLFAGREDIVFDPIDRRSALWHDTISARRRRDPAFAAEGKRIVCGIRRLPSWLLSRVHFEAARSGSAALPTREQFLLGRFREARGAVNQADTYMKMYNAPPVAQWVRTENSVEDLARIFDLDAAAVGAALQHKNVSKMNYVRDPGFWFTSAELRQLYDANPVWRDVEAAVYGDILSL